MFYLIKTEIIYLTNFKNFDYIKTLKSQVSHISGLT